MTDIVSFEDFKESWLESVTVDNPTTVQLGQRFAQKIVSQWLDTDDESLDITYCDGSGDGGIDIAVLERNSPAIADEDQEGDTWYIIQSKYGSAFAGTETLLLEGQKVIETLSGQRNNLSSLASGLLEKLINFRAKATEHDHIRLVYATVDPLTPKQQDALEYVRVMGRARLGQLFDVSAISIASIHDAQAEEAQLATRRHLTFPLNGHLTPAGTDLLVGSVSLPDLYTFLKAYQKRTGSLDQLYEKNVRRFLGGRVKVNKGMQGTLREAPEKFGLYNNGITITVSDFYPSGSGVYELVEPYVVNGCQTTRSIWEVLSSKLDTGGSGKNIKLDEWRERAEKGCVVAKIAKVGSDGEALLQDITRYTNSQNAVREKDFVAINQGFKTWHKELASEQYKLFLEIQRGGWDSQRAFQKQNPTSRQFTRFASALDLTKVYGAGWLAEPGLAFGKNPPFLPSGSVFNKMIAERPSGPQFGSRELYAAYLLLESGRKMGFGRGGITSRRQTKFLYYFVLINLLRDVLQKEQLSSTLVDITEAVIKLLEKQNDAGTSLEEIAAALIDSYMTESDENSVFHEEKFRDGNGFNFDLNGFLKWEQLGRSLEQTACLQAQLFFQKQFMGMSHSGGRTVRKTLSDYLKANNA
ncbi:Abortive phage infection [Rhodomicrobium vannielii ATCC 17100]|uniref:Abortive phage infection n=1 Tax=Rhodomicrobium vannielii (strain ATCC 17100 / DSM 162 / LMG 4299 / NCIMB 10020 / ATH 3.1.1) TaxID=648757 RepID=E3I6L5_RHOVT|nr:AIPR family protein [Rhodomicrobium vannielii]ADP70662.1 Abortive phage infection [Rhodomicrobium vannielii ATCC 17100]